VIDQPQRSPQLDLDCPTAGPIYLHNDADGCDPADVPTFCIRRQRDPDSLSSLAAVQPIVTDDDIAAAGIAASWRHGITQAAEHRRQLRQFIEAGKSYCDVAPDRRMPGRIGKRDSSLDASFQSSSE
jgi:hypothetical protein